VKKRQLIKKTLLLKKPTVVEGEFKLTTPSLFELLETLNPQVAYPIVLPEKCTSYLSWLSHLKKTKTEVVYSI